MRRYSLLLAFAITCLQGFSQDQLWQVTFSDKGPEAAQLLQHPEKFLSRKAIERRERQHIPLLEEDLPVYAGYLQALSTRFPVSSSSKWLNAAWISSPSDPSALLLQLPFVKEVKPWTGRNLQVATVNFAPAEYGSSQYQVEMLNLPGLHSRNFTGSGVLIAVMDAGFNKVDSLSAFASVRPRIKAVRDFVDHDDYPYHSSSHGTMVLSTIGMAWTDTMLGTAPGAEFLLARTEDVSSESPIEELNYQTATEWADSAGADIIHASLGYSVFDPGNESYTYADMDGNNTIITRAAEKAFAKGIFIVNSAGNEGWGPWFKITAPCDGEHVLCVGALEPSRQLAKFSSIGPSYDGRVKPDIVALGYLAAVVDDNGNPVPASGTSFSAPIAAGMVACLLQAHPNTSNTELLAAIRRSGHLYSRPDTLQGYGIPNALKADSLLSNPGLYQVCGFNELSMFPNPSNTQVQLKSRYSLKGVHMEITDAAGCSWLDETIDTNLQLKMIDVSSFPSGIYFLRLFRDDDQPCIMRMAVE